VKTKAIKNINNYQQIAKIAGYLHDLGKANSEFQQRIKGERNPNDKKRDVFRHELVSIFLLQYFHEKSTETFLKFIERYYLSEKHLLIEASDNLNLKIIKLIILTHHKSPTFSDLRKDLEHDQFNFTESNYGKNNKNPYYGGMVNDVFVNLPAFIKEKAEFFNDYIDFDYIRDHTKAIKYIEEINSIKVTEDDFQNLIYLGRFSLMIGDYTGSSNLIYYKNIKSVKYRANVCYAKSIESIKDQSKELFKTQTLSQHLSVVSKLAMEAMSMITNEKTSFPKLPKRDLTLLQKDSGPGKFLWQDKNIEFIKESQTGTASFFVVNSSTGSGKTRFSARLASIVSKDTRFITALGLRNLTLQTHSSYAEIVDEQNITTLIGSKATRELYDFNSGEYDSYEEDLETVSGYKSRAKASSLHKFLFEKNEDYFMSPILVTTVDNIIKSTSYDKGGKFLLPMFKLKDADLILDEVDNFDTNDILSIGKLVFLSGLFNRNVIISTATANKNLSLFLFQMFSRGHELYKKRIGNNSKTSLYFLTDLMISEDSFFMKKIDHSQSLKEDLFDILERRLDNSYTSMLKVSKKHKVKIEHIDLNNIKEKAIALSNEHNEVHLGKTLSVGVIRVSRIKDGLDVYKIFAKGYSTDKETIVYPIFYHSQMPLLYRSFLENKLDSSLNRKNGAQLKDSVLFKSFQEFYGKKNIVIVVIATPVEEVGRDHDFDWSIIDPSSTRSIIQMVGRVLRHRDKVPDTENVLILENCFKLQSLRDEHLPVYCRPGYETAGNIFKIEEDEQSLFSMSDEPAKRDLKSLAPYLNEGINQAYVVSPEEDQLFSKLEEQELSDALHTYLELFYSHHLLQVTNNPYDKDTRSGLSLIFRPGMNSADMFIELRDGIFDQLVLKEEDSNKIINYNDLHIVEHQKLDRIYEDLSQYIDTLKEKLGYKFSYYRFNTISLSQYKKDLDYNGFYLDSNNLFLGVFNKSQSGE